MLAIGTPITRLPTYPIGLSSVLGTSCVFIIWAPPTPSCRGTRVFTWGFPLCVHGITSQTRWISRSLCGPLLINARTALWSGIIVRRCSVADMGASGVLKPAASMPLRMLWPG
ncbi:hypothetical protein MAPG_06767 [Magnaporthiopsis poae ATCC 64411]|uniref:Uncharacterized protein n=1 Tax=Magnaporthiopsis poae (strain ATCC 64411 / 73-15) TaxID=644358 RepID=A0A0C4E2X5_MAGP6|nr:hypothetical protein MAPG_06767 [Magnaporthiopsis poae ATCC 64411]